MDKITGTGTVHNMKVTQIERYVSMRGNRYFCSSSQCKQKLNMLCDLSVIFTLIARRAKEWFPWQHIFQN